MKIQTNVNYNLNPAFGTKLKLTGSSEWAEKLADALEGGFTAQGRKYSIEVRYGTPVLPVYIEMDKDVGSLAKAFKPYGKNDGVFKKVFGGADTDELDLSKPLRFLVEGAQASVKRFVSALKGGLVAQETPQGIAHNSKKTFIAIGDEAKSLSNSREAFLDAGGVAGSAHDKMVEDFFKDAQVIHVTE